MFPRSGYTSSTCMSSIIRIGYKIYNSIDIFDTVDTSKTNVSIRIAEKIFNYVPFCKRDTFLKHDLPFYLHQSEIKSCFNAGLIIWRRYINTVIIRTYVKTVGRWSRS